MQCKSPIGVSAQTSKAEICLPEAAQVQIGFTGFCAVVLCINAELQQRVMQCKRPTGVTAQTSKAEICLPKGAAQVQRG